MRNITRASGGVQTRVCLITNELYPARPGGIGRLMYNFAQENAKRGYPVDLHILVDSEAFIDGATRDRVLNAFDGLATIHLRLNLATHPEQLSQLLSGHTGNAWSTESLYSKSYSYYASLVNIENEHDLKFDYIEFPDYGGWGLTAIQAKKSGLRFHETNLVVRIHSSAGLIFHYERFYHHPSNYCGTLIDIEKFCIAEADIVVGHNQAIIDLNESFYKLDPSWREKTILEFPPITVDHSKLRDSEPVPPREQMDFVFSSRLQPFKRPDTFIKAAVEFLETTTDYHGKCLLASYGWDEKYIEYLKALIPVYLQSRIEFVVPSAEERLLILQRSIVVVPSDFESLCLFAFEAATLGATVILNRKCIAFGVSERWKENENCLMFDGSSHDLAHAMAAARNWRPTSTVSLVTTKPYWEDVRPSSESSADAGLADVYTLTDVTVSVICFGFQTEAELQHHAARVTRLSLSQHSGYFIIPRALSVRDKALMSALEQKGWNVVYASGHGWDAAQLSIFASGLTTSHVLFVPVGYDISPDFLPLARSVVHKMPYLDAFSGQVNIVDDLTGRPDAVQCFLGSMPSVALTQDATFPIVSLLKREAIEARPFDERAGKAWFTAWSRDLVLAGGKSLTIPQILAEVDSDHASGSNDKYLTGGVLQSLASSMEPFLTLLAINPAEPSERKLAAPILLADHSLRSFRTFVRPSNPLPWSLVTYREDLGGLLVHPISDGPVGAIIDGLSVRASRLTAHVHNASHRNQGVEVAVAVVPENADEESIGHLLNSNDRPSFDYSLSAWTFVEPGRYSSVSVACLGSTGGSERIVLASRVPEGFSMDYCHMVFQRVELQPADRLI
jgi:glycosyltransferase involved in cell wall biosynthesis